MTEWKKRLLTKLGRFAYYVVSQTLGDAVGKEAPSVKVTQTRETLTRTTKQTKGQR